MVKRIASFLVAVAGAAAVLVFLVLSLGKRLLDIQSAAIVVFGLILAAAALVVPRSVWSGLLERHFVWIPSVIGLITWPFWYSYAGTQRLDGAFFDVSAQVLPVLLLASVIDVRRSRHLRSYQIISPMLVILIGEVTAVGAVAFPSQVNPRNFAVVAAAIVTAVVALAFVVLGDVGDR
jgi:hypothetical protein